jgi:DNA-binding protein HU-beta
MTKVELIRKIHKTHKDLTQKSIADVLNTVFMIIKEDLHVNDKFTYPGFGTFSVKQRQERVGRNPKNGEKIIIKASRAVSFKPAKALKEDLNK